MHELTSTLPTDLLEHYIANSGRYEALKTEQLPELRFLTVITIFLVALVVILFTLLRSECKENKELHGVIDQMHMEDLHRLKFTEKEADRDVKFEAHTERGRG